MNRSRINNVTNSGLYVSGFGTPKFLESVVPVPVTFNILVHSTGDSDAQVFIGNVILVVKKISSLCTKLAF